MGAFMTINEQTDGHGKWTDGARANGMPACDDQTYFQKQTQTAGRAPLVAYNKIKRSVEHAYHACECMPSIQ